MKAVVAAFNQEKALVRAFSVITSLRIEPSFETLVHTLHTELRSPISKDSFLLWKFSCLYDGVEVVVAEVEAGEVAEVGQHAQLHHHQLVVAEVQLCEARPRPRTRPRPGVGEGLQLVAGELQLAEAREAAEVGQVEAGDVVTTQQQTLRLGWGHIITHFQFYLSSIDQVNRGHTTPSIFMFKGDSRGVMEVMKPKS